MKHDVVLKEHGSIFHSTGRSMMYRHLVFIFVTAFTMSAYSYNARVAGLGGNFIVSDITNIAALPAYINNYPDQLQLTAMQDMLVSSFGIKSLGPNFSVGYFFAQKSHLSSEYFENSRDMFYQLVYAKSQAKPEPRSTIILDAFFKDYPKSFPTTPHLLFGMQSNATNFLGKDFTAKAGLEFFYDIASDRLDLDSTHLREVSLERSILNPGAKFNVNLEWGPVLLSPVFKYSIPKTSGRYVRVDTNFSASSGTKQVREAVMDETPFMSVGGELWLNLGNWSPMIGGFYTSESHLIRNSMELIDRDSGRTTTRNLWVGDYPNTFVDLYAGVVRKLPAMWEVSGIYYYTLQDMQRRDRVNKDFGGKQLILATGETIDLSNSAALKEHRNDTRIQTHTAILSVEKTTDKIWFFDALSPRTGVKFSFFNREGSQSNPQAIRSDYIDRDFDTDFALTTEYSLSTGIGARIGALQLDMLADFGNWNSTILGPHIFMANLTVNFGQFFKKSSEPVAPAVGTAPAVQAAPAVSTPLEAPAAGAPAPVPEAQAPAAPEIPASPEAPAAPAAQ